MRLTIERLRTLVLVLGAILIAALVGFLVVGRWRSRLNVHEIPKRLGVDIKQEANGVTYTQSHGGHTLFKIHASKVVQLKEGSKALLHDVQIELYGQDGASVDRITGKEFEYDQKGGTAKAAGPVEITIERPGVAPAVAPNAAPGRAAEKSKGTPLANVTKTAASGQIDVKTSGLVFDQKTGTASTDQRVEFSTLQGLGSSIGAIFDSANGQLILNASVELNVKRGADKVLLRAQHAEFERSDLACNLREASANYRNGQAFAGSARVLFRADGTAVRLDARDGLAVTTPAGTRVTAPEGTLDFNERNQPHHARLAGGVTMDAMTEARQMRGTAPTAVLEFTGGGELSHVHLERGVKLHSEQSTPMEGNQPAFRSRRDWRSPVADIDFRSKGKGAVELAEVRGTGGVMVTGQTQRGDAAAVPSRMTADAVTGEFSGNQLTRIVGAGHAQMEQTTAGGSLETTSGDRIEAQLSAAGAKAEKGKGAQEPGEAGQIRSATVDGNVVLTQTAAVRPDSKTEPPATLRATAGRAVYEGTGEWLHLTVNPRINDGGLQLAADRVDIAQGSGDAFARGNVKATWMNAAGAGQKSAEGLTLGGEGPAHVVAAEAQLHEASGEATFRGRARLWQQANSISAPVIVLNRDRQTLVARGGGANEPVNVVMLSAGGVSIKPDSKPGKTKPDDSEAGKTGTGSVIRIRAGDLKYSEAERKATLHGGAAGPVAADTGTATVTSNEMELVLLPPGNHAAPDGGSAQVDRMTAGGHVVVASQGRRGTGEQLQYLSETGEYVLTGTPTAPPRMVDAARGTVTGESLIFNSRNDSVNIEGQGGKTSTETTAPK